MTPVFNLPRCFAVFRRDLAHNGRRSLFWVWALALMVFAWVFSTGAAKIESGDSSVGGTKAQITSEFAISQQLALLTTLCYGFFAAVAAGMAVIQDDECQLSELLHATPLRPGEYVWGKFLAVVASALVVLAIHLVTAIVCNHVLPAGEAREFRGPFHLAGYVKPALLFNVPTVVFMAGVSFAVGTWSRRPVLVFFLPLAVFLGCGFLLWEWAPSWLDPRLDQALMLIDPGGFRWLNETWLKVDRGVTFYNTKPVPLDGVIIANRVLMLALGLGAVALCRWHLAATLRGAARRAERGWAPGRIEVSMAGDSLPCAGTEASTPPQGPLAALGMTAGVPGLFAGAWAVARAEMTELRASAGLYLFIPLLVLEALAPNLIAVGPFDTPILLTSGTFATRALGPLTVMICVLLMFYTVESLWRERRTGLASIILATPVQTASVLLGKALANGLVAVVVLLIEFVTAAGFLLYQGKVGLEPWPFVLVWGLLLVPTIWAWTAFVMAVLSLARSRYATYAVCLAALFFTSYRLGTGKMTWVDNWPLFNALEWSDLSVLELDRAALVLNRVFVLGVAVLLTAVTARFFARRDVDFARLAHRLRPASLLTSALRFLPFVLVPVGVAATLWVKVDHGFQGKTTERLEKDYWRKNLATYRDWPSPDITAVDIEIALDPPAGRLSVKGSYDLINRQEKALRQVVLTGGLHWEDPRWTWDGAVIDAENRSRLYVITPPARLAPGATARLGFAFAGAVPAGISKRGGGSHEFILPSGVVLTSFGPSFTPVVGFSEAIGVDEDNEYESKEYPDDFFVGQTESFLGSRMPYRTRVKISGPADFTWNSVGTVVSDSIKGGRRTTIWESDHPVNFFNVIGGRWAVRRGAGTAVYYDPAHAYNVAEMVEALDAARRYYSEWFRPYPWNELKLSEFPGLASYAQGFPTNITFSESIGFLTKNDPRANDAFLITAHESAHQWWGNMVAPGKGPGGNLLSEGTADFSALLLFEQVKGLHARIQCATKMEDRYAKGRQAESERPLVKVDGSRAGDETVTYDKTGWVLWMLLDHMGRDRMLEGIQEFFERYHENPDHPVLQDFLAVLRPHAADPSAFDSFADQWFYHVVVPEYRLADCSRGRDGVAWKVTGRVENVGTGVMPVAVAAASGERFQKDGSADPAYREARTTSSPVAGQPQAFMIRCDFEPKRLAVDPDVKVLQLQRKQAVARLEEPRDARP
jgi:ABC-type transport system involved in multi-copper enzyme maturation permease subunit